MRDRRWRGGRHCGAFPVRPLSDWHLSKAAVLLIFDLGPVIGRCQGQRGRAAFFDYLQKRN